MKFAKKLQEELLQEWGDKYLDYKLMKKALKLECPEVVQIFKSLLEAQLTKVHSFMRGQHECIRGEIGAVAGASCDLLFIEEESPGAVSLQCPRALGGSCQTLVRDIDNYKGYASLNALAIRKIIKKFDKRFHLSFSSAVGLPPTADLLVTEGDVAAWLLAPARRLLNLIHMMEGGRVQWPMRQFRFWVTELRAGVMLAQQKITGEEELAPTDMRLLERLGPMGGRLFVKNTFIDCSEKPISVVRKPRSRSQPPPESPTGEAEECSTPGSSPSHAAEGGSRGSASRFQQPHRHSRPGQLPKEEPPEELLPRVVPRFEAKPLRDGTQRSFPSGSSSTRWWNDVLDNCPLSGFPIRLLPYPPFKLQFPGGPQLVDGPYAVLSVLSTWCFQVLGKPLTEREITALDAYMKRCKLGPFRINRALELLSQGTEESLRDFESLRVRAFQRLEQLRHIQRERLTQLPGAVPAQQPASRKNRRQLQFGKPLPAGFVAQPLPVGCVVRGASRMV